MMRKLQLFFFCSYIILLLFQSCAVNEMKMKLMFLWHVISKNAQQACQFKFFKRFASHTSMQKALQTSSFSLRQSNRIYNGRRNRNNFFDRAGCHIVFLLSFVAIPLVFFANDV